MKQNILEHLQDAEIRLPHVNSLTRLRRSFFALCAASAARYRVTFEDVVESLWRTRDIHGRIPLRGVVFIEDLVHAVGCVSGCEKAWTDLHEHHERILMRQSQSRIDHSDAIVFVRRFLHDLRQAGSHSATLSMSLQGFVGDRPLRVWLGEQISDALTGGVTIHQAQRTTVQWRSVHRPEMYGALLDSSAGGASYPFPQRADDHCAERPATRPAVPSSD